MDRRRRALRIVMWTGGLLSFLIAALLVLSFQRGFSCLWVAGASDSLHQQVHSGVWAANGYFGCWNSAGPLPTVSPTEFEAWATRAGWPRGRDDIYLSVLTYGASFNFSLPLWLPLAVVLLPTLASAFLLRRHARRPGHCPACGYDLTGNRSGRCPECGTAVKPL